MARLGKEKIRVGERDNYMEVEFVINVNSEGLFTTTLSEGDVKTIESMNVILHSNGRRNSRNGFFSDKTKNGLLVQIKEVLQECMSRELIEEKIVIKYSFTSYASFGFAINGEIVPNMGWSLDGPLNQDLYWQNGTIETHASNARPTGILMYVKPYKKKTFLYKSGKQKVEYEKCGPFGISSFDDDQYYLRWLESICSTKPGEGSLKEIDYTEDRAEFFVKTYKALCKLAYAIKQFEKPEDLIKSIEQGKYLMS